MTKVKVKALFGRNYGKIGVVKSEDSDYYYVNFGEVYVNEGFGSYGMYPDSYWIKKDRCEVIDNERASN